MTTFNHLVVTSPLSFFYKSTAEILTSITCKNVSPTILPYRGEHAEVVVPINLSVKPDGSVQFPRRLRVHRCPFCGTVLHVSSVTGKAICVNMGCKPRRMAIVRNQLDIMGIDESSPLHSEVVNYTATNAWACHIGDLRPVLLPVERMVISNKLRSLSNAERFGLIGLPIFYAEILENRLLNYAPAASVTSIAKDIKASMKDMTEEEVDAASALCIIAETNEWCTKQFVSLINGD